MSVEFEPSKEAMREGVCHTRQECKDLYASLSPEKKLHAIEALRSSIEPDDHAYMKELVAVYGDEDWFDHIFDREIAKLTDEEKKYAGLYSPHFNIGMGIRNFLRGAGYGEKYFDVHNLDCIYVQLFTDAVKG
jgi:hypothetical protein